MKKDGQISGHPLKLHCFLIIHMKNVRESNNLRNMYIRSITLGGQSEQIYEETDSLKIARAFRKAGRGVHSE